MTHCASDDALRIGDALRIDDALRIGDALRPQLEGSRHFVSAQRCTFVLELVLYTRILWCCHSRPFYLNFDCDTQRNSGSLCYVRML